MGDSVHSGIVDELTASGRDDLLLFVEHLDTTRNPGKEHARMMRDLLRYRYTKKEWKEITDRVRYEELLTEKTHELERHQEAIITSMAVLAEFRDGGTGEHIERTRSYVRLLLERSEARKHYPEEHFGLIARSAVLHDIGKVAIPDRILLKPGPLTSEEFDTVRTHPIIGSYAIGKAEQTLGEAKFLKYAREIIQFHHEKWDGSGYPYGFRGEDIPYAGRLMAIADVYDALVSERPYKKAFSHEKAVEIIASESGRHFDPALVRLFLECAEEFKVISEGKVYDELEHTHTGGYF